MIAVPMLEKGGSEAKKAHATSIAITLPLSIISGLVYFKGGRLDFSQAVKFIPLGIVGAAVGAMLMKKLSNSLLKRIFGALMIRLGIQYVRWLFSPVSLPPWVLGAEWCLSFI